MLEDHWETLQVAQQDGVCHVTIDNPPVNVITPPVFQDLFNITKQLEQADDIKAVVFQSANPDFFIAHFDIEAIVAIPIDESPAYPDRPNNFQRMCERVRTMPKATLMKMAGRAGGGGNEFAASCDMRFGVQGKTLINQMEVALGILPGGTGTQRLARLMGRGCALEICLSSDDIDAETCARWGYLNRVFADVDSMSRYVDRLAARIASWPAEAIALCKESINNAVSGMSAQEGLKEEAFLFQKTLRTSIAQTTMRRALELGLQQRDAELVMGSFVEQLGAQHRPQ